MLEKNHELARGSKDTPHDAAIGEDFNLNQELKNLKNQLYKCRKRSPEYSE